MALEAAFRECLRLEALHAMTTDRAEGDESRTPLQPALEALAKCAHLRDVTFTSVYLEDGGAQLLCSQLMQHASLRKLIIKDCGVAASEVAALEVEFD